ncbi:MAG: M23 family metallopeptidase, partial [Candidatus Peribacteraceae bacterium]|nr:M23 family metallopeptidase [Candidatus Peribacteraceae bacterium]
TATMKSPVRTDVSLHFAPPFLPPSDSPLASAVASEDGRQSSFPAFERVVFPVSQVPDWGAMRTPGEWDRSFRQMSEQDMVPLPRYDITALTVPIQSLSNPITAKTIPLITAKLVYSTRYYGAYDIDAGEFTGMHPGIDLKLAFGTPVGVLAGGRVQTVAKDQNMGLHVIVEHRLANGETFFSIYGHFDTVWVQEGVDVRPGQTLGIVGMTGATTAPHVHLQVDRDDGIRPHRRFWPAAMPSREEADKYTINPIVFIEKYQNEAE